MILGQLRNFNSYQLATILHRYHNCDSDVASIAAWWIYHNVSPKNWSKYMQCCYYISRSKENYPEIPSKFIEYILMNYDFNKLTGSTRLLLPI
jgi:hypothetical protein